MPKRYSSKYIPRALKWQDPNHIMQAVCHVYNVTQAQLLAPVGSPAQEAYMFNLFKHSNISIADIAAIFRYTPRRVNRSVFLYNKKIVGYQQTNPETQEVYFKQQDIMGYVKIFRFQKKNEAKPIKDKRKVVEDAGIDYLEFIRWSKSKQIKFFRNIYPDYGKRTRKRWKWSPEFDEEGNVIEKEND